MVIEWRNTSVPCVPPPSRAAVPLCAKPTVRLKRTLHFFSCITHTGGVETVKRLSLGIQTLFFQAFLHCYSLWIKTFPSWILMTPYLRNHIIKQASPAMWRKRITTCRLLSVRVRISSFSYIVILIGWMFCDRRGPEKRGLSMCLSVCVPVRASIEKRCGCIQPNIPKIVPHRSSCVRLCFGLFAKLMASQRPCLHENTMALSRSQFWQDILNI